ncbi:MAG: DUF1178 family protein [Rhodomicrobium sp.]|nr:DUF1178 family protein [Rhodomicrobium sp.]
MIRYALRCANDHSFEAWFASSAAYEKLAAARQVLCAICGIDDVAKALMTPSIVSGKARQAQPVAMPADDSAPQNEALELMRKLKAHIEQNSDYVGPRFAEEALKIHYEEAEKRNIYGEASEAEVKGLFEEEVTIYPMPVLPEEHN